MCIRCAECGSTEVFMLSTKVDPKNIDIGSVNEGTSLSKEELPYYVGGYFCKECQTFVTVIDEMGAATEKQLKYLQKLCEKAGKEMPKNISSKDAGKMIWSLRKKTAPAATEKQKSCLRKLISNSGKQRYSTIDVDALNVIDASKWIQEILDQKE